MNKLRCPNACLRFLIPNCFLNHSASSANAFFHQDFSPMRKAGSAAVKFYLHLTERTKWTHLFSLVTGMVFPPGMSS